MWPATSESGHLSLRGSVKGGLVQWKWASCHTNCCHVHSFWFLRKLPGAAVWAVTTVFLHLLTLSLPSLSVFISIKTHSLFLSFSSPNLQYQRLVCLYTWSANLVPPLPLWDSCQSSVTEICLLSVPHQGPLFWWRSQNNYELLTVHLLCCTYPWD